jgi:PhzF family phenazine biosynthesis protein
MRQDDLSRRHFVGALVACATGMSSNTVNGLRVDVVHTRVFAATPDGGNPCPVITAGDALSDRDMLRIARRFNLDTAFIVTPKRQDADLAIRYFVPDHEMGISGHATIAAITVAHQKGLIAGRSIRVDTISGMFVAACEDRHGRLIVSLEQRVPVFGSTVEVSEITFVLNVRAADCDVSSGPIQSVSVSRAKLLIPFRDSSAFDTMRPDFDAVWQLCERLDVTGLYPFTRRTAKPNADVEARQFPYRAGFQEDAATGVAAGALAAYLTRYDERCGSGLHTFRVAQGYAMGAPSIIEASAFCANRQIVRTAIRGSATIVRQEQIRL